MLSAYAALVLSGADQAADAALFAAAGAVARL
jgi:hypothetical protein